MPWFDVLDDMPGIVVARVDSVGRVLQASEGWKNLAGDADAPAILRSPSWQRAKAGYEGLLTIGPVDKDSVTLHGRVKLTGDGIAIVAVEDKGSQATAAVRLINLVRQLEELHDDVLGQRRELALRNQDLSDVMQGIVHDVSAPVRNLSLMLEMMDGPVGPKLKGDLEAQFAQVRDLLEALAAYAQAGAVELQVDAVDVAGLVGATIDELRTELDDVGAVVHVNAQGKIQGNRRSLQQVLRNVVRNAINYRGDDPLQLRIVSKTDDGTLTITLDDNGVGVTPEQATRMFALFQRFSKRAGSGIGLAHSRRLLEKQGATIEAHPLDPGCRIQITLPAAP